MKDDFADTMQNLQASITYSEGHGQFYIMDVASLRYLKKGPGDLDD